MSSTKGQPPVVFWAIGGSSVHKIYPFTNVVISWLLERTDAQIILSGGPDMVELEAGLVASLKEHGADISRVHQTAGKWDIRRSLTFVEYADVVVGPETGILNAAAHLDVQKVIMLSHSSRENLTKHWKRAIVLEPDKGRTPCFPCHRLHYSWDHCVRVKETAAALCASNIKPETVYKAIEMALRRDQMDPRHLDIIARQRRFPAAKEIPAELQRTELAGRPGRRADETVAAD